MNRRDLGKGLLGVLAFPLAGIFTAWQDTLSIRKFTKKNSAKVETLEHEPDTHYKTRWVFNTEQEAIEFVQALIPLCVSVTHIKDGKTGIISSGYRGAVRYSTDEGSIYSLGWAIVDRRNNEQHIISDFPLWDLGRAWACLENIRVNGKPVSRNSKALTEYVHQPFRKGNPEHFIYTEDGRTSIGKA